MSFSSAIGVALLVAFGVVNSPARGAQAIHPSPQPLPARIVKLRPGRAAAAIPSFVTIDMDVMVDWNLVAEPKRVLPIGVPTLIKRRLNGDAENVSILVTPTVSDKDLLKFDFQLEERSAGKTSKLGQSTITVRNGLMAKYSSTVNVEGEIPTTPGSYWIRIRPTL